MDQPNPNNWVEKGHYDVITVVSFKEPLPLKKSESRKRNANASVKKVLVPKGALLLAFKPWEPMRRRKKKKLTKTMMNFHPSTCFLTSRPCNPKSITWPIWWSLKSKTTIVPFVSEENIVYEIFSNGWIP